MTKPLRILVVEDEVIIAYLLAEILDGMGHDVCAIEGSQAGAIAAALLHQPDLMIVDEHLGTGSGLAVVEAVLRNGSTPHIFVSGDTVRIKRLMPDAVVIEKPYHETDLARAIRRAMGSNALTARQIDLTIESAISPLVISGKAAGYPSGTSPAHGATSDIGPVVW
jgi:CheY-like chemotaxis protein